MPKFIPGIKEINFLVVAGSALCLIGLAIMIPAIYIRDWIDYDISYTTYVSGTTNVATGYASIGVWDTCAAIKVVTSGTLFGFPFTTTTNTNQCMDTADSGYFSADMVKLCQRFGITAIVLLFLTVVCGVLRLLVPIFRKYMAFGIVPIIPCGLAFVFMMVALILLKDEMLTGMSGAKCFYMCAGADALAGVATILFGIGLALDKKIFGGGRGAEDTKVNPATADPEKLEEKSDEIKK